MTVAQLKRALYEALKALDQRTISDDDFDMLILLEDEFEV